MTRLRAWPAAAGAVLALASVVHAQAPATAPPSPPPAATRAPALSPQESAQPTLGDDREAIDFGLKWLALIDSGKAGAAWDLSSQQLKSTVTRDKFIAGTREARKALGKLAARTPERFARAHEVPGAPAGDYVIIEYTARFAGGKQMTEHLVWTLEDGDTWRVAGYEYR